MKFFTYVSLAFILLSSSVSFLDAAHHDSGAIYNALRNAFQREKGDRNKLDWYKSLLPADQVLFIEYEPSEAQDILKIYGIKESYLSAKRYMANKKR